MEVESHIISLKNLLRRLLVLSSSIKSGLLSRSVLYQHSPTLRFFFQKIWCFQRAAAKPSLQRNGKASRATSVAARGCCCDFLRSGKVTSSHLTLIVALHHPTLLSFSTIHFILCLRAAMSLLSTVEVLTVKKLESCSSTVDFLPWTPLCGFHFHEKSMRHKLSQNEVVYFPSSPLLYKTAVKTMGLF